MVCPNEQLLAIIVQLLNAWRTLFYASKCRLYFYVRKLPKIQFKFQIFKLTLAEFTLFSSDLYMERDRLSQLYNVDKIQTRTVNISLFTS